MRVGEQILARVAELARLRLVEEEQPRLAEELSRILDHVDQLAQVDEWHEEEGGAHARVPDEEAPLHPPPPLAVDPGSLAPAWESGFYLVPRLPGMDGPETADDAPREDP